MNKNSIASKKKYKFFRFMLMFYTVYLILFVFLCTDFRPKHLCKNKDSYQYKFGSDNGYNYRLTCVAQKRLF